MRKHHPQNERMKRDYLSYLSDAKRKATASVDQAAAAIADFERSTGHKDFRKFHIAQAKAFKRKLQDHVNPDTGKPLAVATINSRLMAVKAFFQWLAGRPGYRRISYGDAEYFNLSANDSRIASAKRPKSVPTIDQIRRVVEAMPAGTELEKRDRAVIAFALISGARDMAIATFRLKDVDLEKRTIFQDARHVATKNAKTFTSWFFPVGNDLEIIVADWVNHLKATRHFGPEDPLFPSTAMGIGASGEFEPIGLARHHWSTAAPIREIFRKAFTAAGLPYFNPHSFRHTLARLRYELKLTPEAWKAWSQNLGHESDATTLNAYGEVPAHRQAELLADLRHGQLRAGADLSDDEIVRRAAEIWARRAG